MLRDIINWLLLLLPISSKKFYVNNNIITKAISANNESIDNLRIAIKELKERFVELQTRSLVNKQSTSIDLAYLGNVQTRISVNKNIVILSYDLQVSKDGNVRAVTPFCPALNDHTLNLAMSADSLFLNVLRPWVMGAADDILLTHIRFGPDNPELPENYQKFVAKNNEANKLLASALKEDNK